MLRTCVQRFDVMKNLKKFCKILGTKQALTQIPSPHEIGLHSCTVRPTPVELRRPAEGLK